MTKDYFIKDTMAMSFTAEEVIRNPRIVVASKTIDTQ